MIRESRAFLKKSSDVQRCYVYVVRHTAAMTSPNTLKFSSKGVNKGELEQSGHGPLENYRRVLNDRVNVTWHKRGFRTKHHSVATYEQVKKGLSYFYPKRTVESDGIYTQPINL